MHETNPLDGSTQQAQTDQVGSDRYRQALSELEQTVTDCKIEAICEAAIDRCNDLADGCEAELAYGMGFAAGACMAIHELVG